MEARFQKWNREWVLRDNDYKQVFYKNNNASDRYKSTTQQTAQKINYLLKMKDNQCKNPVNKMRELKDRKRNRQEMKNYRYHSSIYPAYINIHSNSK